MFSLYHMLFQIAIGKGKILNFALMGYSAGGHLALLYAYSTANNYTNAEENPIKFVISEAGPTNFTLRQDVLEGVASDQARMEYLLARNDEKESWENKLSNVSPINYVRSFSPTTILAYGNLYDESNNLTGTDGAIPYSQATAIYSVLGESKCSLFGLTGVEHTQFGEGQKVCPNSQISGEWENTVENYYDKIQEKLT